MTARDLYITPLLIMALLFVLWYLRPYITNQQTRRYYFPAILVKIAGAVALGMIYQFYYSGGDTFTYFNLGSVHIWDAFLDSPMKAFKLIFGKNEYAADTYEYASRIYSFGDTHSYFVVRVAGLFGVLTLNTYSAIAVLFAIVSFSGMWAMYLKLVQLYPKLNHLFAISILFVPSVFFWGSGLLKDTLTIGALGWLTFAAINIAVRRRNMVLSVLIAFIACYVLYVVKIYILLCILPAILFWFLLTFLKGVRSIVVKIFLVPVSLVIVGVVGYYSIILLGETSHRYSIDKFSYTAETTARWNYYVSQQQGGSGYTLGEDYDFSTGAMVGRMPQAVWVALYRPYAWEADNVVMLISGLENLIFLALTIFVLIRSGLTRTFRTFLNEPFVFFSLIFVVSFAFAIGISTYNFGSLVRYKIPLLPFLLCSLFLIYSKSKSERKVEELEVTE